MKKTRFLALALVVAIALMGAGYAWWTDTLVLNSTVKTGYMDVDFVGATAVTSTNWIKVTENYRRALENDVEDYPYGSQDEIVLTIKDLYPGQYVDETVTIKNVGTMPVKVTDIVADLATGNKDVFDMMVVTMGDKEFEFDFQTGTASYNFDLMSDGNNGHNHKGGTPKCTPTCPKHPDYKPPVDPEVPSIDWINPNETREYTIRFLLSEEADNEITEFKDVSFIIKLNFEQQ